MKHYDHFTNASRRLSRFWRVSHLLLEQRYGTRVVKAESETVRHLKEFIEQQRLVQGASRCLTVRQVTGVTVKATVVASKATSEVWCWPGA